MNANNWENVEEIFHTAISLPPGERIDFLHNKCAGNDDLLAELESLVNSFENQPKFLDEPVFEFGLGAIHQSTQKDLSGLKIGSFEIKEKIGSGGMGEVYKAFDTKLNRFVALKFLSESLKNDSSAKRRLIREAQAAAALEHPNICPVYGFEQEDEYSFIVMQFVEGKTLGEALKDRKIDADDFRKLARQILEAVSFAHSHDIIHRDLKPRNIMLTSGDQIKILDFGLAKSIGGKLLEENDQSRFSQNGLIIGTVSYMSPEQLRGEKLDFRSDIFSLGIVFYEIMSGENPFNRPSQAETIAAILSDNPSKSLKELAPNLPASLLNITEKCLQKEKDARLQSAAEILVELDNAETDKQIKPKVKPRAGFFVKTVLAVVILLAFLIALSFYNGKAPQKSLAILPFSLEKNVSADKEYLADGLTQSMIDKLSGLSELKVKNQSIINSYKGKTVEPQTAGKELNVDAVLIGSIQQSGDDLIISTKLVRTSDGFVIDSNESKIEESNLTDFTENLSRLTIGKIKLNLTDLDQTKLAQKDTSNEEAKRLYYLGRYCLSRRASGDEKNAVKNFQAAKELDPTFAKAWTGLADAYLAQSAPGVEGSISPREAASLAQDAVKQALILDNNSAEAYNSLGLINSKYDWNWEEAKENFNAAISRDPEFIPARTGLISVLNALGKFDESLEEARKIKEIAPTSTTGDLETAKIYYMKGDFPQMEKIINDILSKNPSNDRIQYIQAYLFLNTGRFEEAISFLEKKYKSEKPSDKIFAAGPLGFAYAKAGRRDDALKVVETLDLLAQKQYVAPQEKAFVYIGLGNFDEAFENLNQSCNERFYSLAFWVIDPVVKDIKSDPRFNKIKECVNL